MKKMTCTNGKCEYKPTLNRTTVKKSKTAIKYAQLWAEIELPKLLKTEQR
jgi:hypothetical protein